MATSEHGWRKRVPATRGTGKRSQITSAIARAYPPRGRRDVTERPRGGGRLCSQSATLPDWFRGWARDPIARSCVGSNPTGVRSLLPAQFATRTEAQNGLSSSGFMYSPSWAQTIKTAMRKLYKNLSRIPCLRGLRLHLGPSVEAPRRRLCCQSAVTTLCPSG